MQKGATVVRAALCDNSAFFRFQIVLSVFGYVLAGVAGCGPARPTTYPTGGIVKFTDETPVRSGYIELIPVSGGPSARGKIENDGTFVVGTYSTADGAAAGDFVAIITQYVRPLSPEQARKLGPEHAEHAGANRVVSLKYSSRQDSDLACTVSDTGKNHLVFKVDMQLPSRSH